VKAWGDDEVAHLPDDARLLVVAPRLADAGAERGELGEFTVEQAGI
jgi:hypothetical protein